MGVIRSFFSNLDHKVENFADKLPGGASWKTFKKVLIYILLIVGIVSVLYVIAWAISMIAFVVMMIYRMNRYRDLTAKISGVIKAAETTTTTGSTLSRVEKQKIIVDFAKERIVEESPVVMLMFHVMHGSIISTKGSGPKGDKYIPHVDRLIVAVLGVIFMPIVMAAELMYITGATERIFGAVSISTLKLISKIFKEISEIEDISDLQTTKAGTISENAKSAIETFMKYTKAGDDTKDSTRAKLITDIDSLFKDVREFHKNNTKKLAKGKKTEMEIELNKLVNKLKGKTAPFLEKLFKKSKKPKKSK